VSGDDYRVVRHWMNGGALTGFLGDETKDELYPVIDEVLHERSHDFTNAGSAWIDYYCGDDAQLRIHELAEALCDAIVAARTNGSASATDVGGPS